jgi:hypothetical protein
MFPHIISGTGVITATIGDKTYIVDKGHLNYTLAIQAIKDQDEAAFVKSADIPEAVKTLSHGRVIVEDSTIFYLQSADERTVIHNAVNQRIIQQMGEGFHVDNLLAYLDELMQNTSKRAVDELFPFLDQKGIPIDETGCFLGYKSVWKDADGNLWDWRTKSVRNNVGDMPSMPRNMVDDNFGTACSEGFHVGNLQYGTTFYSGSPGHVVTIVRVNPKNVVSVPDSCCDKLRCCEYEVIGIYDGPLPDLVAPAKFQPSGVEPENSLRDDNDPFNEDSGDHWEATRIEDEAQDESDDDELCPYCEDPLCDWSCGDEDD